MALTPGRRFRWLLEERFALLGQGSEQFADTRPGSVFVCAHDQPPSATGTAPSASSVKARPAPMACKIVRASQAFFSEGTESGGGSFLRPS